MMANKHFKKILRVSPTTGGPSFFPDSSVKWHNTVNFFRLLRIYASSYFFHVLYVFFSLCFSVSNCVHTFSFYSVLSPSVLYNSFPYYYFFLFYFSSSFPLFLFFFLFYFFPFFFFFSYWRYLDLGCIR